MGSFVGVGAVRIMQRVSYLARRTPQAARANDHPPFAIQAVNSCAKHQPCEPLSLSSDPKDAGLVARVEGVCLERNHGDASRALG
ncbi:MAG: hypothetical protein Q8O19_07170 [Rectinemataceae bacterium]|nr:hypothetical protein [Rectinemataceae bacterium]